MIRKGYENTLEEALNFFEIKFKGTEEYERYKEILSYVKKYGLQHEVFVLAYNYCEDNAVPEKCLGEIYGAAMEWDI